MSKKEKIITIIIALLLIIAINLFFSFFVIGKFSGALKVAAMISAEVLCLLIVLIQGYLITRGNEAVGLDIITFEKRHQAYGANDNRVAYTRNLSRSIMAGMTFIILGFAIPFIIFEQTFSANEDRTVTTELLAPPPDKQNEEAPPPPPPPEQIMEQKAKFTAPIIVTDTTEVTADINQDDLLSSTTNTNVNTNEEIIIDDDDDDQIIEEVIETQIFTVVEEMPSFPGGEEARIKFLTENIKYPEMAKESNISGTVYVTFVIDEKGRVADAKILRGIGGGCDEEALRVVRMMPPWNPGKQSGKSVRVQFNMPIQFILK